MDFPGRTSRPRVSFSTTTPTEEKRQLFANISKVTVLDSHIFNRGRFAQQP